MKIVQMFKQCGTFDIHIATSFTNQFRPWYLGMAFTFTVPLAVGGYNVLKQERWRRPEDADICFPRSLFTGWLEILGGQHGAVGAVGSMRLFNIIRGLPHRIEGQYGIGIHSSTLEYVFSWEGEFELQHD